MNFNFRFQFKPNFTILALCNKTKFCIELKTKD